MNADRRIAVHFNFRRKALSVREIHPVTGALTRLLALRDFAALVDVEFTVDATRLDAWRRGGKHTRQFAELRGFLIDEPVEAHDLTERVYLNPKLRDDFHLAGGQTVLHAPRAALFARDRSIWVPPHHP